MPGSLGSALPGVGLRLVDDLGHEPETGDPGEIQIRGANLFSGYWPDGADGPGPTAGGRPATSASSTTAATCSWSTGRPRWSCVAGFSVYPREVEAVIGQVPGVAEAAVIGVPDERPGTPSSPTCGPRRRRRPPWSTAVRGPCDEALAAFKRPTRVEVVDQLPTTLAGRVRKGELRQLERRRALGLLE